MTQPIIIVGNGDAWGIVPTFLDTSDPRPAREQIDANYVSGWSDAPNVAFDPKTLVLSYPGDPDFKPLSLLIFRDERLLMYEGEFCVIMQKDGSWRCARLN